MRVCRAVKLLSAVVPMLFVLATVPVNVEATQPGCKQVCVKTDLKCIQTEKKCTKMKQECAQLAKRCLASKTHCLQRNAKTGQCISSQEVCAQYEEYCAKYRQVCDKFEDVCIKKQEVCLQYKEECPPAQKGKMSCRECNARRTQCHNQCDRLNDLVMQNRCVTQCNNTYGCIIGVDCYQ